MRFKLKYLADTYIPQISMYIILYMKVNFATSLHFKLHLTLGSVNTEV